MSAAPSAALSSSPAIDVRDPIRAAWLDRLPWSAEAAPRKSFQLRCRLPRERAVRLDEINPNPRGYIKSVVVDVDYSGAGAAWLDARLPQPTFVIRSERGHAHLVWHLERWVRRDNERAMRLLEAVQAAITSACAGDRAYVGPMHHNPLSTTYSTIVGHRGDFTLYELADCVPDLLFRASSSSAPATSGFRDDFASAGRNCRAFETARLQAYREIAIFKASSTLQRWIDRVTQLVTAANAGNLEPLPASEVRSISKSIASWCWSVYRAGSAAANARRQRYKLDRLHYLTQIDARRQAALKRRNEGASLSTIATELGVSRRSVCRYLGTSNALSGASDKSTTIRIAPPARVCARLDPPSEALTSLVGSNGSRDVVRNHARPATTATIARWRAPVGIGRRRRRRNARGSPDPACAAARRVFRALSLTRRGRVARSEGMLATRIVARCV